MDYKELLKKYWFVGVVAVVLLVFVGVYAADAYKNRELTVAAKDVDGKSAVYSVDGEYVFADDFYNSLYNQSGLNAEFIAYQRAVFSKAYETTDDMNTIASNYASYMYQQYGKEYVDSQLAAMGYVNGSDDLINYYIDAQKRDLLVKDYCLANVDQIVTPYIEENDPRVIYHILVKVEDVTSSTDADGNTVYTANPTQEETNKLNGALEALKTKSFQDVASEYSDDSSATYGGYIGLIDKNTTQYVQEFKDASMALKADEVSEPVLSQYGYHIIWNAGQSVDTLLNEPDFLSQLETINPTIAIKAITEKAEALGFEIVDENLKTFINAQLESGDAQ